MGILKFVMGCLNFFLCVSHLILPQRWQWTFTSIRGGSGAVWSCPCSVPTGLSTRLPVFSSTELKTLMWSIQQTTEILFCFHLKRKISLVRIRYACFRWWSLGHALRGKTHILYKGYFYLVFKSEGFNLTTAFFGTWTFKLRTVNSLFCVKHICFDFGMMWYLHGQVKSTAVEVLLEVALHSF